MFNIIFNFLIFYFFTLSLAISATYYVDQNNIKASDKNPGTKELPWKTIQKAAFVAKAGDLVIIKKGTYDVGNSGVWSMPAVNPKYSGTPKAPIIFRASPLHKVRIIGSPMPIGSYGRKYIVWDGFILGTKDGKRGGVIIFYSKGIVIKNCEIIGCYVPTSNNHDGIRVQKSEDIVIKNCKIHGIKGDSWNSAGIKFYFVKDTVVENCEIYDCYTGIFDKTGGIHNTYRRNIIYDTIGPSIYLYTQGRFLTDRIVICQNIFYKTNCLLINTYSPLVHKSVKVYNNVFYGLGIYIDRCANVQIWNNIFYTKDFSIVTKAKVKIIYCDYNCFFPYAKFETGKYTKKEKKYKSLQEWQSFKGLDLFSINKDPLFVSPKKLNFHLKKESPCLKAGIDRQDYDNDGNINERINMGCYIENEVIGTNW